MGTARKSFLMCLLSALLLLKFCAACSNGTCGELDLCSKNEDCASGFHCFACTAALGDSICVRSKTSDPFTIVNNSLPFNKYSYLTTHNSFAIDDGTPRITFLNQEDGITHQLNNGVRALMLDTYDYEGQIWLCHSFGGQCHDYTKFGLAIDTLKKIADFLSKNPSELVTIILEDYVHTPNGLTKLFADSGLNKYWFPLSKMPRNGGDWPRVSEMVATNERLVVFTSIRSKEATEGIAYQWNYMVETQYGDDGMDEYKCTKRDESSSLNDTTKSLFLVNYFRTVPLKFTACIQNSGDLAQQQRTCAEVAGRWPNFVAVDYYKRSLGGGAFDALDLVNGRLLCGCDSVRFCGEHLKIISHNFGYRCQNGSCDVALDSSLWRAQSYTCSMCHVIFRQFRCFPS